jgi:hypothetical protein
MFSYMVPIKVTKLNGQQIFVKLPNIKYHENQLVVLKLLHIGKWTERHRHRQKGRQAGRQTDMAKLNSSICNCVVNAPKM